MRGQVEAVVGSILGKDLTSEDEVALTRTIPRPVQLAM